MGHDTGAPDSARLLQVRSGLLRGIGKNRRERINNGTGRGQRMKTVNAGMMNKRYSEATEMITRRNIDFVVCKRPDRRENM